MSRKVAVAPRLVPPVAKGGDAGVRAKLVGCSTRAATGAFAGAGSAGSEAMAVVLAAAGAGLAAAWAGSAAGEGWAAMAAAAKVEAVTGSGRRT